jgi:hypothetical protein
MTTTWRYLLATGIMVAGCSTTTQRPTSAQLQEGITLLDVRDPMAGLSAAYKEQGRVVYVETRVGAMKPEVYRNDAPDAPQYEMDMRFVDQNNNTFYAMRGGDRFVDPTWNPEIATSRHAKIDVTARALDFKLAQAAAAALGPVLPASFKDHAYHAAAFAKQPTPSEDPQMIAKAARIAQTPPPALGPNGEQGYSSYNYSGWSWLETDKYSGSTSCFLWTCAARHSATRMWDCVWTGNACSWVFAIDANNHGRHATDSGMGYDCYSNGGWYWNVTIDGSTAGDASGAYDNQGGCQTGYSWSSSNWAHLCNDDAAYELWQAKYGSADNINFSASLSCWGSLTKGSPSTFSCSYPNGDWNTPNCP